MEIPKDLIPNITSESYNDYVSENVNKYAIYIGVMAGMTLLFSFIAKFSFSLLGENVTLRIRYELYQSILRKNISWFDETVNSPSVLTSAMAEDTSIVNGVSTESLATILESFFSIIVGVGIGFYYCWQLSIACLILMPFMGISGTINAKITQQKLSSGSDKTQEANLLAEMPSTTTGP
jgi:ATP-binding cassette, subfamily B (MDR/TAP), member 1